ncbi:MAG: undecaprenyldiphospho-muramoylpentapeptide beta-N-acetylglucosaminyltransferase [Candidatus Vogelbacteria bacterium]|nr:undecaprenyldiphospho-muramoylpentapeptide beta-N-acetylglucosaminyltransferase [Candidatus Vogelbacteria bacterium]
MKILFTGGGTGGHFYPIIAVAQEVREIVYEKKLLEPEFYFMSADIYNERALLENKITFIPVNAGKIRRYFSIANIFDVAKTIIGIFQAIIKIYRIYPDVIFAKGGYSSVPALWAAKILNIPVVIHESDSHPGRANLWAAKFAKRIAVSYPEAVQYFPKDKTAVTGNPIRKEILYPIAEGAKEYLKLTEELPIILVLGGSQGAVRINDLVLDLLPELTKRYQIIHQTGKNNFTNAEIRSKILLEGTGRENRYKPFAYLNDLASRMAAGATNLVVSRAGSAIFEIAQWGVPSIIIPIPEAISHDQRTNAFTYARSGACVVIEENNLSASVLLSEIDRLFQNPKLLEDMKNNAKSFSSPNAARTIADELVKISLSHA